MRWKSKYWHNNMQYLSDVGFLRPSNFGVAVCDDNSYTLEIVHPSVYLSVFFRIYSKFLMRALPSANFQEMIQYNTKITLRFIFYYLIVSDGVILVDFAGVLLIICRVTLFYPNYQILLDVILVPFSIIFVL
jgi:hypothetical protein